MDNVFTLPSFRPEAAKTEGAQKKTLLFRLSSLGDVVLATAALPADRAITWVVRSEFAPFIEGHPRVRRVTPFTRGESWKALCRRLWEEQYDEVIDAHGSLRTLAARIWFTQWSLKSGQTAPSWTRVPKQRLKRLTALVLKALAPKLLTPTPWYARYGKIGAALPALPQFAAQATTQAKQYCVMPSSAWVTKEFPTDTWVSVITRLNGLPVILGRDSDAASDALVRALSDQKIPHRDARGTGVTDLAQQLAASEFVISTDTGLAHVAEAVGTPAVVLYGPTSPALGFGVRGLESLAVGKRLACRPCSKDGRHCYRLWDSRACTRRLSAEEILGAIQAHRKDWIVS